MIIHEFDLDMIPDNAITTVKVNQYDDDFNLKINLFSRKGGLTIQAGTEVIIRGKKPDGHVFSADCSINGNVVTVVGNQQMTAAAGRAIFELSLRKNGKELNSANFIMKVERAPMDKDTPPSNSVIRELVDALDHTDEILEAAESVEEWLSTIDDTLSQPNKAADAKKTGDEIADLKSALDYIDDALSVNFTDVLWESGGINLTDGLEWDTNNRIRTGYIPRTVEKISLDSGYQIGIYGYDSSNTYLGMYNGSGFSKVDPHWYSSVVVLTDIPDGYKLRLLARKESNDSISQSDAVHISFGGDYTDTSLSIPKKAADAKVVGDRLTSLEEEVDNIEPLSNNVKAALLACFQNVAWTTGNSKYLYDELRAALYDGVIPDYNKAFTISNIVIGIANYGSQGYSQDTTNKEFACADLSSYTFMVDDIIRLEDTQRRYKFGVGTNNNQTSSDGGWNYKPLSTYDCLITQEHLPDTKVLLIKKVDGTIFTNEDIILLNSLVNVYRSAEQDPEPEWGRDYTWLYRADQDGLLSSNTNVSEVKGIGGNTPATETIIGNVLNIYLAFDGTDHGSLYELLPSTVSNGVIKMKVKFNSLPDVNPGAGLRVQVSNGTNGAQFYIGNLDGQPSISAFNGSVASKLGDVTLNEWHILSCELSSGGQIIKIDNTIYRIEQLSSYVNTKTRIICLEPAVANTNLDLDVAWITFNNTSV